LRLFKFSIFYHSGKVVKKKKEIGRNSNGAVDDWRVERFVLFLKRTGERHAPEPKEKKKRILVRPFAT
jgi:hypothetical protein